MSVAQLDININPLLNIPALNKQLDVLKGALGPLGNEIKPINEAEWNKSFRSAIDGSSKLKDGMGQVGDEIDKASKKSSLFEKAFKFSAVQQGVSTLVSGIGGISSAYIELDTATASLKTLGDEAAAMAPNLRASAITMSKDLPFAAAELQTTMFDALASGVKGGEEGLKSFADTSAKLAVGGGSSIGDSTKLLAGQLNAYGKTAEDAAAFSDIFFNTVNFGVTSIPELTNTLSNVIPTAAAAGVELENIGASLAVMTSKGIPTAQATTKLNGLLLELQKPGAALKPILDAAGVSLESLKNDDLPVTLGKVKKALEETGKASVEVFSSSEAGAAFSVLAGDIEGFQSTFEGVRDTAGSAQFAYEQMGDSVKVKTDQMLATVNAFVIDGLDVMGSGFVGVVDSASKLAPLVSTVAGLGSIIPDGTVGKLKDFGVAIISKIVPGLITQTAAQGGATAAQLAFNAAALANPYVLAAAGVVAVIGGLVALQAALKETAAEKLDEQKSITAVYEEQRKETQSRYDAIKAKGDQTAAYKSQVDAVNKAREAASAEGLTIDERAAKTREATAAQDALRQKTVDLTAAFPTAVNAGKSFEENLAGMQAASLATASELIKVAGEISKLDQQIAASKTIELQLAVQVAGEDLQEQIADSLDMGFAEGLASGNIANTLDSVFLAGFGNEISSALFGTSFSENGAKELVGSFQNDIYGAKSKEEIAKAQSDMIAKIAVDGEKLGIDKKEQQKVIQSIRAMGDARVKELETQKANEENLSAQTSDSIAKAFADATSRGKDVASTVDEIGKAFGLSKEKVQDVAIGASLDDIAKKGAITEDQIAAIAKQFGRSGEEVKKAAFESEIKKATAAGAVTEKQIEEIATRYGRTTDEARLLVAEQQKQVQKAKETGEEVKKIGDAFNESKKAASEAVTSQTADLAELNRRYREARTKREKDEIDAQRREKAQQGRAAVEDLQELTADEENARKALGLIKGKALKTEKDISDQLLKIRREASALSGEIYRNQLTDEEEIQRESIKARQAAEAQALLDEITAAKNNKELTLGARRALEEALTDKMSVVIDRQTQERSEFELKAYGKRLSAQYDAQLKAEQTLLSQQTELASLRIEAVAGYEVKLGEEGLRNTEELNTLKLEQMRSAHAAELNVIIERNEAVVAAQEAYKKALATGDLTLIEDAGAVLDAARKVARETDPIVVETARRQAKLRSDAASEADERIRQAEIDAMTDLTSRKRELTILEAQKAFDAEMELVRGNDALELEAHKKLLAAKKQAELDYLIESNAGFATALALTVDLATAVGDIWSAENVKREKKEREDHEQRIKDFADERTALEDRLKAGVLMWEDYQSQLADLDKERADAEKERAEKLAEAEEANRNKIAEVFKKQSDAQFENYNELRKKGTQSFDLLAASAITNFGAMIAAQAAFGDAVLATLLDMMTKTIAAYIPEIIAASVALLGPIAGPIAAGAAIVTVMAGAAAARSQIGAHDGFQDFNPNTYTQPKHGNDRYLVWIGEGESLLTKTESQKYPELIGAMRQGKSETSYFESKYGDRTTSRPSPEFSKIAEKIEALTNATKSSRNNVAFEHAFDAPKLKGRDIQMSVKKTRRRALRRK